MKKLFLGLIVILVLMSAAKNFFSRPDYSTTKHIPLTIFLLSPGVADLSEDPEFEPERFKSKHYGTGLGIMALWNSHWIHSTDYKRTRRLASYILSFENKSSVQIYDPRDDLPDLVEEMREGGGKHLVVGHRSTTPVLLELLGVDEAEIDFVYDKDKAKDEDDKFDNYFYAIQSNPNGTIKSSTLSRYYLP